MMILNLLMKLYQLKKRIKAVAVLNLALVLMLTQTGCGRLFKESGNESEERLNASVIAEKIEESSEDSGEENSESGQEWDRKTEKNGRGQPGPSETTETHYYIIFPIS